MRNPNEIDHLISEVEAELARLNARKAELLTHLVELRREKAAFLPVPEAPLATKESLLVTNQSSQDEKVALFRNLFRGREDVYPKRFVSLKTGKAGYAPACRNEWGSGIWQKSKKRNDDFSRREFLPVTDEVVRSHLLDLDPRD